MNRHPSPPRPVAIIGGGPAGLAAAEVLSAAGISVDLYDAMPSVGRKFLMAGKSGLNLTHAEPGNQFLSRYGEAAPVVGPWLTEFGPEAIRAWCDGLGIATFVGSSGRVFPTEMKAAPLLRAWVHRLRTQGVRFHMRHRWTGWNQGQPRFASPGGEVSADASAVLLALGGASWPQLGSDGRWAHYLADHSIPLAPFRPANCGFDVAWSEHFLQRFAGEPVKAVIARASSPAGASMEKQGEFVITEQGIEGSLVYALSAPLRDRLAADGRAEIELDLVPGKSLDRLSADLRRPRGRDSHANHLRRQAGIQGVKAGLIREFVPRETLDQPDRLAWQLKHLAVPLVAPRPLAEAISTAGGVVLDALDERLMLKALPGVFCAGEMLDWEAPTGGYLLTACLASGRRAARGILAWLEEAAI